MTLRILKSILLSQLIILFSIIILSETTSYAGYNEGINFYNKENYSDALFEFKRSQSDAKSLYMIGLMHANGDGVDENQAEAQKWYLKSANMGFYLAQSVLGKRFANGIGVKKNLSEAFNWYMKAAKQGDENSQANIGVMYNEGMGVKKDYKQARVWYKKASKNGSNLASFNLAILLLNKEGGDRDSATAIKLLDNLAQQDDFQSNNVLFTIYNKGANDIVRDPIKAFKYLVRLATIDSTERARFQFVLAVDYGQGTGTTADIEKAAHYMELSARGGYPAAQKFMDKINKEVEPIKDIDKK